MQPPEQLDSINEDRCIQESAVSDYVAHLRNQEYKPGLITGGRTGSTRFARFLVDRPIAKGEQVRGDWQTR